MGMQYLIVPRPSRSTLSVALVVSDTLLCLACRLKVFTSFISIPGQSLDLDKSLVRLQITYPVAGSLNLP